MPYLDRFDYDIFISYSWSDNQDENQGDRQWVKDLHAKLQGELIARLPGPVLIFLDVDSPRNGDTDERFQAYTRRSAIFLAIVTPGFCKETSYCRKELDWFYIGCRPISNRPLDTDKRLFKIEMRPPREEQQQPDKIASVSRYTFYDGNPGSDRLGYRLLGMSAIDSQPQSRISTEYGRLVPALASFLNLRKQEQYDSPIRTIFLAESSSPEKTQVQGEIGKHEVVSCPESPGITEATFIAKTDEVLASSDISLHLIDTSPPLASPPRGWQRSVVENQLLCAHGIKKSNFCAYVWCESPGTIKDPDLKKLMLLTQNELSNTGHIKFITQGIQYFTSNLPEMLARGYREEVAPPLIPTGRRVFIQCVMDDIDKLEPAFQILDSLGIGVQIPAYEGTPTVRNKLNKMFLTATDGTLIYWGSIPDAWLYMLCNRAVEVYGAALDDKKRIIGIDPPNDNRRKRFSHPAFITKPFPTDPEKLTKQLLMDAFL